MNQKSLWFDEALTFFHAKCYLPDIIKNTCEIGHPPFYRLFLHFWLFLNKTETWLRLPSVFFSLVAIWLGFKIARRICGRSVALAAAFLMAISPFQVYYAQEIRLYALFQFFGLLSFYYFISFLEKRKSKHFYKYIIAAALFTYTHYFAWYYIFIQNIYLFMIRRKYDSVFFKWLIGQVVLAAFFAPWINSTVFHVNHMFVMTELPLVSFVKMCYTFKNLVFGYFTDNIATRFIAILLGVLFYLGCMRIFNDSRKNTREARNLLLLFMLYIFLPVVATFCLSKILHSIYLDRTFINSSLFYYLILAAGFDQVKNKKVKLFLATTIILISLVFLYNTYREISLCKVDDPYVYIKKPVCQAAQYVNLEMDPEDMIVVTHHSVYPVFLYYWTGDTNKIYLTSQYKAEYSGRILENIFKFKVFDPARHSQNRRMGVWLVNSNWQEEPVLMPEDIIAWMSKQDAPQKVRFFRGMSVYYFAPKNET